MEKINVMRLVPEAVLPTRAHQSDAGMDLYSVEDTILEPNQGKMIPTGIALAIPEGFVGMIADRSSMGKKGIKVMGGIVDAGYRGEVKVILWNVSDLVVKIDQKSKIAQMLLLPVETPFVNEVFDLDSTERGEKGFGSSGA